MLNIDSLIPGVDDCDDTVVDVDTVMAYAVSSGRNAWNGEWSTRRITYSTGVHLAIETAIELCEKMRVQGSVFTIRELPALLLSSRNRTIVVADIENAEPFCGVRAERVRDSIRMPGASGVSMSDVTSVLMPSGGYCMDRKYLVSVNQLAKEVGIKRVDPAQDYSTYKSKSFGGGYRLHWKSSRNNVRVDAIQSLLSVIRSSINGAAFDCDTSDVSTAVQLWERQRPNATR